MMMKEMKTLGATGAPRLASMKAIKGCLDQLVEEAAASQMPLAAMLIGAASEAIADDISQLKSVRSLAVVSLRGTDA